MADEKFKLGDVVSLRTGGPRMTIATVDGQSSFLRMVYRRPTTAKQISTIGNERVGLNRRPLP